MLLPRKGRHAAPHRYAVWKLTYYRSGRIDAYVSGSRHRVIPGTVLVVPPNADHAEVALTDLDCTPGDVRRKDFLDMEHLAR